MSVSDSDSRFESLTYTIFKRRPFSYFSTINSELFPMISSTQLRRFDMVAHIAIHGVCGQVVSAVHTVYFLTSKRRFESLAYTFFLSDSLFEITRYFSSNVFIDVADALNLSMTFSSTNRH